MSETREVKTARGKMVLRSVTTRKIQREQLKDHQGNNKIRSDWQMHQSHGKDQALNDLYLLANGSTGRKRQKLLARISNRITTNRARR